MLITIYTIGARTHGLGHVKRCIVLGQRLAKLGHEVAFVTLRHSVGYQLLVDTFSVDWRKVGVFGVKDAKELYRWLREHETDVFIIDIENGPERPLLRFAKRRAGKIVVVGGVGYRVSDPAAIDEFVDLQIFQAVALNENQQYASRAIVGAAYLILDPSYSEQKPLPDASGALISMGGGDPHNLTPQIAEALWDVPGARPLRAVCGDAMHAVDIAGCDFLDERFYRPRSLAPHMAKSLCLVAALGMTVYEALRFGIPVACTAWSEDHEETALTLQAMGVVKYLGIWNKIDAAALREWVALVSFSSQAREQMMRKGRELVDGRGAERVAEAICNLT